MDGNILCLNICDVSGIEADKIPKLYISMNSDNFIYFIGVLNYKVKRGVCVQKD